MNRILLNVGVAVIAFVITMAVILLLAGCSSLPSGLPDYKSKPKMVELPDGAMIFSAAELAGLRDDFETITTELRALRAHEPIAYRLQCARYEYR